MGNQSTEHASEPASTEIEEKLLAYCRSGNYSQVVYLFDKYSASPGFDVNCRDASKNTPLLLAARQGHGSIVQELLRFVPDITVENSRSQTVMSMSTSAIHKMVFGSVSACLQYSERLFCNACWLGNAELVERFLAKQQVRPSTSLVNLDGLGCCALVLRNMGQLEAVARATRSSYKPAQTLQSLLSHWGGVVAPSGLLHAAAAARMCSSALEVARVLLRRAWSELGERDEFEFTAIHHAARAGNASVLELLLEWAATRPGTSALIDCQGRAGNTALHLAAMEGREDCVRMLLSRAATPQLVNAAGCTPTQCAKSARIKNVLQAAEQTGAPPRYDRAAQLGPLPSVGLARAATALAQPQPILTQRPGKCSAEPPVLPRMMSSDWEAEEVVARLPALGFARPAGSTSRSVTLECLAEHVGIKTDKAGMYGGSRDRRRLQSLDRTDSDARKDSGVDLPDEAVSRSSRQHRPLVGSKSVRVAPPRTPGEGGATRKPLVKQRLPTKIVIDKTRTKSQSSPKQVPARRNEVEVVYESDFQTDNSSTHEDENEEGSRAEPPDAGTPRHGAEPAVAVADSVSSSSVGSSDDPDSLKETMRAPTRQSLDRLDSLEWRRGEQLGKGSYGTVWKGLLEDGRYIAVKEIVLSDAADDWVQQGPAIRREIDILAALRHRNIVRYLGAADSGRCIQIFMEFVAGGSLASMLAQFGPFSEPVVRVYSRQLVAAVAFLHRSGVLHRDLKGANVMVTPSGVVKLVDFGCAKKLENVTSLGRSASKSQQSRLQGSVYWLAPEVINGAPHSHQSDVWSVGCTVIEMVTTRPPWTELHPYAAMFAIGTGKPPLLNLREFVAPGPSGKPLSLDLCHFIEACLIRDVARRPSAKDLLSNTRYLQ